MASASRTFVCSSSAFASPKSANTFPELISNSGSFLLAMTLLIKLAGNLQPLPYVLHILLRRLDALLRFLLKRVKRVNHICEANRIDRTIRAPLIVLYDLEQTRALAFPRLARRMLFPKLGQFQRSAHCALDDFGELLHHPPCVPDPYHRLHFRQLLFFSQSIILFLG